MSHSPPGNEYLLKGEIPVAAPIRRRSVISSATIVLLLLGCGGSPNAKYIPSSASARDALQTALSTWKSGGPAKSILKGDLVLNVNDERWRENKKLESFEIVEQLPNTEQPQFKVHMKLAGESEESTTYLVIGINPLNIFRDEDYKHAQTW